VVKSLREQVSSVRQESSGRYSDLLIAQQKLSEKELDLNFMTSDNEHLRTLLEKGNQLQTQLSNEL